MLQFLAPAFLIGLVGLLIPIFVHLWNTRDSRIIKVGSIRWIQESESVKVSRIRLSEIPLMLLRLAILLLLVLLLADMRSNFFKAESKGTNWVLVDPSIHDLSSILDSIKIMENKGWEAHFMQSEFPLIDEQIEYEKNQNFWRLLKELDLNAERPDSILVISRSNWSNFRGERPVLGMVVNWVTVPSVSDNKGPALALSINDSLLVYYSNVVGSNVVLERRGDGYKLMQEGMNIYSSSIPEQKIGVHKLDTLRVKIIGDSNTDAFKNLAATINTVNAMSVLPVGISKSNEPEVVFNLTGSEAEGSMLMFSLNPDNKANGMLLKDVAETNRYFITKDLSLHHMMKYDFVEELYYLLTDKYQNEIRSTTNMELPLTTVQPQWVRSATSIESEKLATLAVPLWLLLISLLAIERIISFRRNQ